MAGIIAAAGVYALEHHVERLGEDHDNAARLACLIADIPGVEIDVGHVDTNMVYFGTEGTGKAPMRLPSGSSGTACASAP